MFTLREGQRSEILYHLLDLQCYSSQPAREVGVLFKYALQERFHENNKTSLSIHITLNLDTRPHFETAHA